MKKIFLSLCLLLLVSLACDLSFTIAPPTNPAPLPTNSADPASVTPDLGTVVPTLIPATLATDVIPTLLQQSFEGVEVSVVPLSIVIPPGVASGARGSQFSRADGPDLPYWNLTPGHTILKLEGYLQQGKAHEPQIYVYPAQAYAEMIPAAFESIHRLNNILYAPGGPLTTISANQLPTLPFFNAQQSFASYIQVLSFQNGGGVRFLTEYAQHAVSANNQELFYQFQGVTRDGAYYVIAIFPITAPVLAETSDGGAVLPLGGTPYLYFADPGTDMQGYYTAVTSLLNATSPDVFRPTINQLDLLIQSMRIQP